MTATSRHSRSGAGGHIASGVGAIAAMAVLLVGVPALLAAAAGWPLPTELPSVDALRNGLASQLTWPVIVKAFVTVAWLAWAQFALCVAVEARTAIRARGPADDAPRVRLAGLNQALARRLVTSAAALLVTFGAAATPVASADTGLTPARPASAAPRVETVRPAAQAAERVSDPRPATPVRAATRDAILIDIVEPRDCLWDIAERHLGDGMRYREIFELNKGRTQPDGAALRIESLIQPGWQLHLPPDAVNVDRVIHRPATEPNAPKASPAPPRTTDREPGRSAPAPPADRIARDAPPAAPAPPATVPSVPTSEPAAAAPTAAPVDEQAAEDRWVEVLGGTLLAGLLLLWVQRAQARQFRFRRPGRTVPPTPPQSRAPEDAVQRLGAPALADVRFVDCALRSLSAAGGADPEWRLPDVVAARMIGDRLHVRLAAPHPAAPPAPWTCDETGRWWSVSTADPLPVTDDNADDYLAPYPTLVSVGREPTDADDNAASHEGEPGADGDPDSDGEPDMDVADSADAGPEADTGDGTGRWLVDLEAAGALALTGDVQRCLDLGRYIASELAVNTWSDQISVTLVGFGAELVAANPMRLRYTENLQEAAELAGKELAAAVAATENFQMDVLTGRLRAVAGDRWMPHVLLVAPHVAQDAAAGELDQLLGVIAEHPQRTTVAVVLAGDQGGADTATWRASVSADGALTIPTLGVTLTAHRMPAEQAAGIAQMLEQRENRVDAPMPPATGPEPYAQFIDAAGGLRPEVTLPRSVAAGTAGRLVTSERLPAAADAGSTSVLPEPDSVYLADGAATSEELQILAPRVSAEQRAAILGSDPNLDRDFDDWWDPECPRPKLTDLGPVGVRARGRAPRNRPALSIEIALYLDTRPHGATVEEAAAAFGMGVATMEARISPVRKWLGTDPATGQPYLPDADKSPGFKARGVGVYQVLGALRNGDLFTRYRKAGTALGGSEGIAYLEKALSLVAGKPYDQLRPFGYRWLTDGEPLNQYLITGVVDVAHIVHLHYLQAGDLQRAQDVTELALSVLPWDEASRLDLVAVMKKHGLHEAAERYLRDEICNFSDDREGPLDPPARTLEILRRSEWLRQGPPMP